MSESSGIIFSKCLEKGIANLELSMQQKCQGYKKSTFLEKKPAFATFISVYIFLSLLFVTKLSERKVKRGCWKNEWMGKW